MKYTKEELKQYGLICNYVDDPFCSGPEIIIDSGTQPGTILAVQGHGMPNLQNKNLRGKLLLEVNISIPKNLNENVKSLLKQINL